MPLPHGNIYPFFVLLLGCITQFKKKNIEIGKLEALTIAFVLWSFLSAFWSAMPAKSFQSSAKVASLLLGGCFWWNYCEQLKLAERQQLKKIVCMVGFLLAGLLIIFGIDAQFRIGSIPGLQNGLHHIIDRHISQALVHGCAACMLAIWMNKESQWIQIIFLVLLVPIFHWCSSDAASLGILLGLGALIGYRFFPKLLKIMFIYGMPIVWFCLPFIFFVFKTDHYAFLARIMDSSYTHRLFIWQSVAMQTFEHFWTGFGFGSSRYRSAECKQDIIFFDGAKDLVLTAPENCLHPHNFMLQIWFELGAIGVILACLIWIMYWKKQYDRSACYTITFWGSALGVAATGISIWQTWWLILLVTLAPIYRLQGSANN
ncbi:MAG: O-antigen ligase family protein [Alphaproteobacteria bacterium]|nr:O-antigen ligase family protein [Alphaproteobacteria bacterium]